MDFRYTEEQRMLQESVREMMARDITPILKRNDAAKPLPKEEMRQVIRIAADLGLTSLRIPESHGGQGLSNLETGMVYEAMPAFMFFAISPQDTPALRICLAGTKEQADRYVPKLISGELLGASGISEPFAGSDPRAAKTYAREDGDHWIVTGHKMWVSGAYTCDLMLTSANVGKDERGAPKLMWMVIDRNESPFETTKIPTMGLKQGHTGEAMFDACRVPKANVLGNGHSAPAILQQTWLSLRPTLGLVAVGTAQRALDAALDYAGLREMFGRKIGGFQLVQELLADAAAAITSSRLLCYAALQALDNNAPDKVHLSAMAKRFAIAQCTQAVSKCMEVHGAMGISVELGLEEMYRDIRMLPIPDGTNQIMTLVEGRELTGISAIR